MGDLKQFVKSSNEMKYFLIVILWDKLFAVPENRNILYRVLQVIKKVSYYEQIFISWLNDIPAEYLKVILPHLHKNIEVLCNRLVEEEQSEESNKILA